MLNNSLRKKATIVSVVVIMLVTVLNFSSYNPYDELSSLVPSQALATTEHDNFGFGEIGYWDKSETDYKSGGFSDSSDSYTSSSYSESHSSTSFDGSCNLSANTKKVYVGSNVEVSWSTSGFAKILLNGEELNSNTGTKTFTDLQENTTYTLEAIAADGNTNCVAVVKVTCLPNPPVAKTCSSFGYDFHVEKFEWNGNSYVSEDGPNYSGYDIEVSGSDKRALWTSKKDISAVIAKAATNYKEFPGGLEGYVSKCEIGDGCHDISNLQFCANEKPPAPMAECTLEPSSVTVDSGESTNLTWTTTNAVSATLTDFGAVDLNGSTSTGALTDDKTYFLEVVNEDGKTSTCSSEIVVKEPPKPAPVCDMFTVSPDTIIEGNSAELAWKTTNATRVTINNGIGEVGAVGNTSVTPLESIEYLLTVFGEDEQRDTCKVNLVVEEKPEEKVPMCLTFDATPFSLSYGGGESELSWTTKDADKVMISGIGEVPTSGSKIVDVSTTTVYTLKASDDKDEHACYVTIDVDEYVPPTPDPTCTLNSDDTTINNGESTNLTWTTTNAVSATLTDFGAVDLNGSTSTGALTDDQIYNLMVEGENGETIKCSSEVKVEDIPDPVLSCADNVNLSASPNKIDEGNSSTITWSTTDITEVSFDKGIDATTLDGSVDVSPAADTTYTMTAGNETQTISCPITVSVDAEDDEGNDDDDNDNGGGGGGGSGSSSPQCELSISDNNIESGDEIELVWDSRRATELMLVDSEGNVLVDTDQYLNKDKKEWFDGSMLLYPTVDTAYLLTVERGSRDRECTAKVNVDGSSGSGGGDDSVVVTEIRDQQPLVAGIALSDVPYTGFEAGPVLTTIFYLLLVVWAFYIAYLLVVRRDVIAGYELATPNDVGGYYNPISTESTPETYNNDDNDNDGDDSSLNSGVVSSAPLNLPVDKKETYTSSTLTESTVTEPWSELEQTPDEIATEIENYAHTQHTLLSSGAIRVFMASIAGTNDDKIELLEEIISSAKTKFPAEDGWIVVNESRMKELCDVCIESKVNSNEAPYSPVIVPKGSGSLAEAIVAGNVVAAYELIGNRPMFALADAASDLDSVYRVRKGEDKHVSDLLVEETKDLTDEQILNAIGALTGALDGTYNDEASAVKMAIMKAVKAMV